MAKSLISETKLKELSKHVKDDFLRIEELWKSRTILDYEAAGLYILVFYFKWKPLKWIGSKKTQKNLHTRPFILDLIPNLKIKEARDHNLYSFFATYQLKHIPATAQMSLLRWADGIYPLIATRKLPSSLEVLNFQTQNKRVVSLLLPPPDTYVLGERDPMSFVLHDLIHAYHFFENKEVRNEQLGFYQCMQKSLSHKILQEALLDAQFAKDFEYLISDMNSVSLHMCMSLKSIFLQYYLRQKLLPSNYKLNTEDKKQFEKIFLELVACWCSDPQALQSLLSLNEPYFDKQKDGTLLTEFFKKMSPKDSSFQTFRQV